MEDNAKNGVTELDEIDSSPESGEEKAVQEYGLVTRIIINANIFALVIMAIFFLAFQNARGFLFFLPYALNLGVFYGTQKRSFIQLARYTNYFFFFMWTMTIFVAFVDPIPTWKFFLVLIYMLIFGLGTCWFSAHIIHTNFLEPKEKSRTPEQK